MLRPHRPFNSEYLPATCWSTTKHVPSYARHTAANESLRQNRLRHIRTIVRNVLQGNGAGPAIWLLISSPMINMLRTQGFGFTSSNILSNESYTFTCYTYVDDTDLIHNSQDQNANSIIPDMQRMLDHWAGGLRATGGALVPAKSYWYGSDFKWNQKKLNWEYKSVAELPGSLILRDHLQQPITLRRMEATRANKTLGLWIAADGNQITQMQVLLGLVERWIDKICTKQLTKTEAWLSLRMGVAKALRYPL
jgi:hypothetical protein